MRWAVWTAAILILVGSVSAEDAADLKKTLSLAEAEEEISYDLDSLKINDVTFITPEVAATLAKHGGEWLSFPDLKMLTPEAALALSNYKGELSLDGLEQLSVEAAQALAQHEGRLILNGILSLSDDAALALSKHRGGLYMDGLRELRCERLARELLLTDNGASAADGGVSEFNLTAISPQVAELLVIASQDGGVLGFYELKSPSIDVLRVLARLNGDLHLGIVSLTPAMARVLATQPGNLHLVGIEEIDKAVLETLVRKEGGLELSLTAISPEIAELLAGYRGALVLNNDRLSEEAELLLAKSEAESLTLPHLKELRTADFTRRLIESQVENSGGPLELKDPNHSWLLRIEDISLAVAEQLKEFPGVLRLPNIERVSNEVADTLSESECDLILSNILELTSVPFAKKLVQTASDGGYWYGEYCRDISDGIYGAKGLRLKNVTHISPDVARALASHKNECLSLNGLTSISDEVADALSDFPGILSFGSVTHLSPYAQEKLGQGNSTLVCLGKLKELTDPLLAKKIKEPSALEMISLEALAVLADRYDHLQWVSERRTGNFVFPMQALTLEQATVLAKRRGGFGDAIFLDSVKQLDAATAAELAKPLINISLAGLREITPEIAAAFANHREAIYLPGIEAVPVEVARALAEKKCGHIFFDRIYNRTRGEETPFNLPEESALLLRNHPHIKLPRHLQP